MVNPDEWDILASQIEDRDGNEITVAEARKRDLKARRDAIRKKEIAEAMAAFEAQPEPKKKKKSWRPRCCIKTRKYLGCCYWKTLHEAVIDCDKNKIVDIMMAAQEKDEKNIGKKAGVERTRHQAEGDGSKEEFQGYAAKIMNEYDEFGRTPLSLAIKEQREDMVEILLGLEANPDRGEDYKNHRGRLTGASPMMGAAQNKMSGSILDLHSRHANIDKKNMQGITPVHLACLGGDADLLEVLLEQGGDPEAKDRGGGTPLIYAAYAGHLEGVKAILETGASIKAKDKHKHTAYDWAMYIRKKTKSYKHGVIEAYLEDYKPALYVKRRS